MNIQKNPKLLMLGGVIFLYFGLLLPIAQVNYQSIPASEEGNTNQLQTAISGKSPAYLLDDTDGKDVPPCIFGQITWVSDSLHKKFIAWKLILTLIAFSAMFLWSNYTKRMSMGKSMSRFFMVIAVGVPIFFVPLIFSSRAEGFCDFSSVYKITTFTPNWGAALLIVTGVSLGYLASRPVPAIQKDALEVGSSANP